VIALMLALKKQLLVWTPEFMRRNGWRGRCFPSMLGATVGVVGLNQIGHGAGPSAPPIGASGFWLTIVL
jgi:D-3-phosphoglycerate dehydrogenase / 2-oxoglutarate reductase